MIFTELTEEEFMASVKDLKNANFHQTAAWAELKKFNGWDSLYVGIKENDKIIGASLILIKKLAFGMYMGYAPRGFLIDFEDKKVLDFFTEEVKKYAKSKKIIFIKIDPYYSYQERDCDGNIVEGGKDHKELVKYLKSLGYHHHGLHQDISHELQPRWIEVLDIKDKTYDEVFKEMRKTTKKRINRSKNSSLKLIEVETKDQIKEFKDLMQDTAARRGFIDRPLSYYEKMFEVLKKEDMIKILFVQIDFKDMKETAEKELAEVNKTLAEIESGERKNKQFQTEEKKQEELNSLLKDKETLEEKIKEAESEMAKYGDNRVVSTIMFIPYLKEMLCLLGASYKEYMKYNIQYLLNDHMIKYACDNHYELYNMYGIDGYFTEDSEGFGLFDFKRGLGGVVVELIGEFDLVTNKFMYFAYTVAFKLYKSLKNLKNRFSK